MSLTNIPNTLDEAIIALETNLSKEDLKHLQDAPDEKFTFALHHGLGQYLRNTWGLWNGSSLKDYFGRLGIYHADDMSGIILTSLWRKLHSQPINLAAQVQYYKDYWNKTAGY